MLDPAARSFDAHVVAQASTHIGTAGWSIGSAYADRFPPTGTALERYASELTGVEINSSFYRSHRRQTYERWALSTPAGFRFSVKLPKIITHEKRLLGCEADLDRFLEEVRGLGPKLGVILVQLPPNFGFNEAVEPFLRKLRTMTNTPVAVEPRHGSWSGGNTEMLLADYKAARVAVDPSRFAGDGSPAGSTDMAYFRFHGSPRIYYSGYEPDRLSAIAADLHKARNTGKSVWCIFDNTAAGHALGNALAVAAMFR